MEYRRYSDAPSEASSDIYASTPQPVEEDQQSVEMDLSSPDSEHHVANRPPAAVINAPATTGKRKLTPESEVAPQLPKKARTSTNMDWRSTQLFSPNVEPTAGVPAEVWQHVFSFLPPNVLARCVRVSRSFKEYLSSLSPGENAKGRQGLRVLDSESIWSASRERHLPGLPKPLMDMSELQMLQLLGNKNCQLCGHTPHRTLKPSTVWDAGPGTDGVRIIWPFAARLCGNCFYNNTITILDILKHPSSNLRLGLPHAFRTHSFHYVPSQVVKSAPTGQPNGLEKVHYLPQLKDLQLEQNSVKARGHAAANEWSDNLIALGRDRMTDASRWETWEAQHPLGLDTAKVLREYLVPSSSTIATPRPITMGTMPGGPASQPLPIFHPLPQRVTAQIPDIAPSVHPTPQQSGTPQAFRPPPARNIQQVNEAKAARRAEIERRCRELEPPLLPGVLQHMAAFQNAMMLARPFGDMEWQTLLPLLAEQREDAEQLEYQRAEQLRALQATAPDYSWQNSSSRFAQEAANKAHELQQGPVRAKLGRFAEEVIRDSWQGGAAVTKDNLATFAADVLLQTRAKYLEDAKPDRPFLTLENMKYVMDQNIRPFTDPFSRNFFYCSQCAGSKTYAFEGVMQHYGAKHTQDFTFDNVIVHWQRAEWPDEPPFYVPPCRKSSASSANGAGQGQSTLYIPQNGQYGSSGLPFASPASFAQTPYASNGPFPPPTATLDAAHTPISASSLPLLSQLVNALQAQGQAGTPALQMAGVNQSPYSRQTPAPYASPAIVNAVPAYGSMPAHPHDGSWAETITPKEDQLNEIAKVSRGVWDSLKGVKDLIDPIKVQAVIQHVKSRFRERFGTEPSLFQFTEALANHILMQPIKDAKGLACSQCISSSADGAADYSSYLSRIMNTKMYNFSSLLAHFKSIHLASPASQLDWTKDMMELPEDGFIRNMMNVGGMDDKKLAVLDEAFPSVFPYPLPKIGSPVEKEPRAEPRSQNQQAWTKNKKGSRRNKGSYNAREDAPEILPEPAEDEYDPRRPAIQRNNSQPQAKGRKSLDGPHNRQPRREVDVGALVSTLKPETLAALSHIKGLAPDNDLARHLAAARDRSASIPGHQDQPPPPVPYYPDNARSHYYHLASPEVRVIREPEMVPYGADMYASAPPRPAYEVLRPASRAVASPAQHHTTMRAVAPAPIVLSPAPGYGPPYAAPPDSGHHDRYVRYAPPAHEPVQYMSRHEAEWQYGERPPRYVDEYGRPVQVVHVMEAAPAAPLRYGGPHAPEYVRHESQYRYEPVLRGEWEERASVPRN